MGSFDTPPSREFTTEARVAQPTATPLFADAAWPFTLPHASDWPATDLYNGGNAPGGGSMSAMTIPRHGSRPMSAPRNWPASAPLPGAVNVAFFDGHAQAVKLDGLWQLYWHVGYVAPPRRPGLR
jgi:prepilin-type processing-associated H-X9-DG protein